MLELNFPFIFTTVSRPVLGPTQPPIQWVSDSLSLAVKRPGREADQSHIEPRLRMRILPKYVFLAWCLIKEELPQLHSMVLS